MKGLTAGAKFMKFTITLGLQVCARRSRAAPRSGMDGAKSLFGPRLGGPEARLTGEILHCNGAGETPISRLMPRVTPPLPPTASAAGLATCRW